MKKRIVCFGDSNTWGYIPITGERYDESIRWPARLQEKLGYQDYTVVEEGLTGRTTVFDDPFDPELNGLKTMPAVLRSAAPIDVLVFMLGTNDFQSNIPAGNPISTARAVQYMLETASTTAASWASVCAPWPSSWMSSSSTRLSSSSPARWTASIWTRRATPK